MSSTKNEWLFIDTRKINKSKLVSLYPSVKDTSELYQSCTTKFRIENTTANAYKNNKTLSPNKKKELTFSQEFVATFSIITFWLLYLSPVMFILVILYTFLIGNYRLCVTYIICYILSISQTHSKWPTILHNTLSYSLWDYFSFTYCCNADTMKYIKHHYMKRNKRNLLILSVPHAVIPMSPRLALALIQPIYDREFIPTQADILYYLPVLRTMSQWIGIYSVSKQSILQWLKRQHIVEIIADGIAGIYAQNKYGNKNIECIALKDKKGIAKLAIQTESDVIVAYAFGDTRMFDVVYDKMGLLEWISRKLRAAIFLFYGRYYIPFVPYRQPLYYVLGPIVKNRNIKTANPDKAQIDEYHSKLLASIKGLFDEHKAIYGWQKKNIVFV